MLLRLSMACRQLVSRLVRSISVSLLIFTFDNFMPRLTNAVGNEQELNRGTISSNIDDRTNHEVRPKNRYFIPMLILIAIPVAICRRGESQRHFSDVLLQPSQWYLFLRE